MNLTSTKAATAPNSVVRLGMIRRLRNSVFIFVTLSVLLHISAVAPMFWTKPTPPPVIKKDVVEVTYEEVAPAPDAADLEQKQLQKVPEKQIVEQVKQLNDELDPTTHRLSAFNQKVIKETKAAKSGKFNNTAKGGKPDQGSKDGDRKKKIADKSRKARERGELPDLNDLTPKYSDNTQPSEPDSKNPGEASQSDDYLKDVQTGMQTLLSTREFVYFSYYQRIKDQIRQYWEPGVREKVKIIYRQGRTIASAKDRMTQVLVTLDSKGSLIKVEIVTQSGVQQLDDAAAEAFRAAAPFPNPPAGMIEEDGTIKIRWDFILEARSECIRKNLSGSFA